MKDSLRQQFERLACASPNSTPTWPTRRWRRMKRFRALTREQAEVAQPGRSASAIPAARSRPGSRARDAATTPTWPRWRARKSPRPRPTSQRLTANCRPRCCRATPTTSATPSWRSAPAPAATNRRCSPATWCACTCAMPNAAAGGPRSCRESASDLGGYKEVVLRVEGDGVYGRLRFESGGHRVQRVPATETPGPHPHQRLHGGRAARGRRGRRGQAQPGRTAHRHLPRQRRRRPARQQDRLRGAHHPPAHRHRRRVPGRRSPAPQQGQGDGGAAARLRDKDRNERAAKEAATRKGLIGSGDRSDRIRTYNFPQGRLTDHRINLTLYKLGAVMDGDLDEWSRRCRPRARPSSWRSWKAPRERAAFAAPPGRGPAAGAGPAGRPVAAVAGPGPATRLAAGPRRRGP